VSRWEELGRLVEAEHTAYTAYVAEKNPSVGRVYPTRVTRARKAWVASLDDRNEVADALAVELGVRRSSVLGRYLLGTYEEDE